ncbi:MAG: LacI family DNA-binding transcriptional regulator [Kiritimatiellae bacterium]|nr:LacI family DNA-binding transcriptional regulator [Kiritimatiellia bacterium]
MKKTVNALIARPIFPANSGVFGERLHNPPGFRPGGFALAGESNTAQKIVMVKPAFVQKHGNNIKRRCNRGEVAARAGVSSATVSRAFNLPGSVSREKLRRVLRIAKELDYFPDRNASALRRRGTGTILLAMPRRHVNPGDVNSVYGWSYTRAIQSVQDVLDPTLFRLQLAGLRPGCSLKKILEKYPCEGVIVGHDLVTPALARFLKKTGLPHVCCARTGCYSGLNVCYIDEFEGGRLAARIFRERKLARPAHITWHAKRPGVCRIRWEGYRAGWEGRNVILQDGEPNIQGGYKSAMALAPRINAGEIDCIFVVNDLTAVGVIYALLEKRIRIPADVALLGYDNLPFIHTLPVKLATLDISFGRLYARAAECLLMGLREPVSILERIIPVFVPGDSL